MSSPNPAIPFTYDDYRSLPESMSPRYELLQGDLLMVPSRSYRHQRVSSNLYDALKAHVSSRALGQVLFAPFDVVLGEGGARVVVQPDLLFVAQERENILLEDGAHGPPDLVVEVLSPGTRERDLGYKATLYARYGVREYWLVDPDEKSVEVRVWAQDGWQVWGQLRERDVLNSQVLPQLRIDLSGVF